MSAFHPKQTFPAKSVRLTRGPIIHRAVLGPPMRGEGSALVMSVKQMIQDAGEAVSKVTAEEAHELISGRDALLVDVRDSDEVRETGKLRGALNVSRGMLEFRADPDAGLHNPEFRKDRPVILYCASGGRSALAGKTLRDLGYSEVYNLGGFKGASDDGFPTEPM